MVVARYAGWSTPKARADAPLCLPFAAGPRVLAIAPRGLAQVDRLVVQLRVDALLQGDLAQGSPRGGGLLHDGGPLVVADRAVERRGDRQGGAGGGLGAGSGGLGAVHARFRANPTSGRAQ